MFGKIKGKLGDIFKKNEEHIEENADEVHEEVTPTSEIEEKTEEKKGFFSRVFSKKEQEEEELAQEIQDDVLDGFSKKEQEEIKSGKELSKEEVEKHKKEVEEQIKEEEELEKQTHENIPDEKSKTEIEDKLTQKTQKLEEAPDFVEEEKTETIEEKIEDKKGFFSKVFSKKEENVKSDEIKLPELEENSQEEEKIVEEEKVEDKEEGFFSKALNVVKKKKIDDEDYDKIWLDLEIFLLEINVAYEIVEKIGKELKHVLIGNSFDRFALSKKIREVMVSEVESVLSQREGDFLFEVKSHKERGEPLKIMMLGVNGTGKTTSIGKIIKFLQSNGFSVVVAAADTFRAAAVDQIAKHCDNLGVKCIQHKSGGDPAAVAFDAVEHAKAKGIDVVLIDTAGRMPNNSNLMMELQKVKRVSKSEMALFIGDSISGNDLIEQINLFDKGVEINGVVLTKVDTDERPGSIVTCSYSIKKPIYFLGVGQGYDDLVKFDAKHIAEKLFEVDEE